jgi:hypothetical protein
MIRLQIQPICRDSGAVPPADSAQPLWEAELILERALLPYVPSSIWGMQDRRCSAVD